MKVTFKKKINIKLVVIYSALYLLMLYWYITFPPPPEYGAGPIISAVTMPFLIIFTIKSIYDYFSAPREVELDINRRLIMFGLTEVALDNSSRRLIIIEKNGLLKLVIEKGNDRQKGGASSFFPRALYKCEIALEDIKLGIGGLEWVTFIEE